MLAFKLWKSVQPEGVGLASTSRDGAIVDACLFVSTSVVRSNNQGSEHRALIFGG